MVTAKGLSHSCKKQLKITFEYLRIKRYCYLYHRWLNSQIGGHGLICYNSTALVVILSVSINDRFILIQSF